MESPLGPLPFDLPFVLRRVPPILQLSSVFATLHTTDLPIASFGAADQSSDDTALAGVHSDFELDGRAVCPLSDSICDATSLTGFLRQLPISMNSAAFLLTLLISAAALHLRQALHASSCQQTFYRESDRASENGTRG